MATTTEKWALGSAATLLSTELNSLANNARAIGSAYDNTQGQTGDGFTLCDLELVLAAPGGTLTANTSLDLHCLMSQDGTNYSDGDASTTPSTVPNRPIPVRAVSGAQRIVVQAWLPWGKWKPLLINNATGQALGASGNTLKVRPATRASV